ncbi:hypothetical protein BH11BAC2_BH11BAC2_17400 [soil metagenome]
MTLSVYSVIAQKNGIDYYVQQAFLNSPLLKDYNNQVRTNQIDSLLIKAGRKPQINSSITNIYYPRINGYSYDQSITNGGLYSGLISVNKTITGSGNISHQLQSLQISNESLSITAKISEQGIKKEVISQYITTYGDLKQYQLNEDLVSVLHAEEIILKNLTEKGLYRQTDYLTFFITIQEQELNSKQILIKYQDDLGTLNYLCGISDTSFVLLSEPQLSVEELPAVDSSSFLKQFTLDSLQLVNKKILVDFNYKPKVNLFADAGYNSSYLKNSSHNFGASLGFNITLPIYDGNQRKLQDTKIDIADQTRSNYKSNFSSQSKQQIQKLRQQLNATLSLIAEINKQISYFETLINADKKLVETGEIRITDYIIAFSGYLNIKNQLTLNTINSLQIINQINYWNR